MDAEVTSRRVREAERCDREASRRAVNLTLRADLVEEAKALGLNVSQIADAVLREAVRQEEGRRWQEENAEAIQAHDAAVERRGPPLKPPWRR